MRSDRAVEYFQREIQRHMERRMGYSMPPDYTLTLIFHDVDMAGAYEPWLRPPHDRVRVVRSTYPPRLQFDYTLLNEEGEVIASGSENIVDLVFQMQIARRVARDDNLFYEKEILDSWFRDTIRNLAIDPS